MAEHQSGGRDSTTARYFSHSYAQRVNTDAVITKSLKAQYPGFDLVVVPQIASGNSQCDLLTFAAAGHATAMPLAGDESVPSSLQWKVYVPPARRIDGNTGALGELTLFGKYVYKWNGYDYLVYLVDGRDGAEGYPKVKNYYIICPDRRKADELIMAVGVWGSDLHNEVWVFDGGSWTKSAELWQSANKSTWDAVILDEDMKKALIDDHVSFFESRETYTDLKVPWKRGIIYHGPPGNGE